MKKILLFGIGPLPFEDAAYNHSGGNRTWYIYQQLSHNTDCAIDLYLLDTTSRGKTIERHLHEASQIEYFSIPEPLLHEDILESVVANQSYDGIVSVTTYPSYFVSKVVDGSTPWWTDLHGDVLMEAQSKSYVMKDNMYVQTFMVMQQEILAKADMISTCSQRQTYATIGELGMAGRLTKENEGIAMVHTIPILFQDQPEKPLASAATKDAQAPFAVLSIGGYNTWVDVQTLFAGLEKAMEQDEHIEFWSTGAGIPGHDMKTYERFEQMVQQSRYRERFHLCGFVDHARVDQLLAQCDIGVNVDRYNYEGVIGGRNRIHTYIAHNLPVISTTVSETPAILAQDNALLSFPVGDTDKFAQQILHAKQLRSEGSLSSLASHAYDRAREYFARSEGIEQLIQWTQKPIQTAKDADQASKVNRVVVQPSRIDKALLLDIVHFGYSHALKRMLSRLRK